MKELNLKLHHWQKKKEALDALATEEEKLRIELVKAFFPKIVEGQQSKALGRGWSLFCNCVHDRSVNETKLTAALKKLKKYRKKDLVRTIHRVNKKTYGLLTKEERDIFDDCLSIEETTFKLTIQDEIPF